MIGLRKFQYEHNAYLYLIDKIMVMLPWVSDSVFSLYCGFTKIDTNLFVRKNSTVYMFPKVGIVV